MTIALLVLVVRSPQPRSKGASLVAGGECRPSRQAAAILTHRRRRQILKPIKPANWLHCRHSAGTTITHLWQYI